MSGSAIPGTTTTAGPPSPRVLELRVHGVNNTTPAALLDLPHDGVRTVEGDALGSFWEPTPEALAAAAGRRGAVPEGIRREAYSWGGMVRTAPRFGGSGAGGTVVAVLARIFYAIILPFSIGNAVMWTRKLSLVPPPGPALEAWRASPEGRTSRLTAGAGRFFGLILTLLFTTTAVTLALDIGASQCAALASLCGPLSGVFAPLADWSAGRRLALFALGPVIAVIVLWVVSAIAQVRYDVLPGMSAGGASLVDETPAEAVLSQRGFWSNRVTRYLARAHLSAAVALTALFVGLQTSFGWYTGCTGLVVWGCYGDDLDGRFWIGAIVGLLALVALLRAAWLVWHLPTMSIQTEEETELDGANRATGRLLTACGVGFGLVLIGFAILPTPEAGPIRLYGAGTAPLLIALAGGILAATGVVWRPKADRGSAFAWAGRAPVVFMTLSLAVAVSVSAITVVAVGDFLNGARGPAALIGGDTAPPPTARVSVDWIDRLTGESGSIEIGGSLPIEASIQVSRSYVAMGALILFALLIAVLVVAARLALVPKSPNERATTWRTAPTSVPQPDGGEMPPSTPEHIIVPPGGVLPPSRKSLFARIEGARTNAARAHLMEQIVGAITIALGVALAGGIVWTTWSYVSGAELWPTEWTTGRDIVIGFLDVSMTALGWVGLALVAALAAGATAGATRPLGIVWDIACYLPRTGQPFGPPCYAERAVPEIAGRLHAWLREDESHRAILAAHSMGAVLSISSLGLLASSNGTRQRMGRIAVLTFGVQLRSFFGRMLPELLGPAVIGSHTSLPPEFRADPWEADAAAEAARPADALDPPARPAGTPAPAEPPVGRISGTLLPRIDGQPAVKVRWVSLWRLTDYLGYPAFSTAPSGPGWENHVDRYATELDKSGYMVEVGTHGEYYRVAEYAEAVEQLRDQLVADPS